MLSAFAPYLNTPPPDLTKWAYTYDPLDQLNRLTEPADQADDPERVTDHNYDKVGNLTKVTEPNAATTTDPNDFTTSYTYDPVDQLIRQIDGDGDTTEYGYDGAGNLAAVANPKKVASADPDDVTATYTYDLNHRPLTVTDADGGDPYKYGYDVDGQVTSVTDEAVRKTTFDYDRRGLRTRVTQPHDPTGPDFDTAITEYRYDQVGNRTHVISPRGVATTGVPNDFATRVVYDELNRVDRQFSGCAPPAPCDPDSIDEGEWPDYVDFDYDNVGNLAKVSRPPSGDTPDVRAETTYDYTHNGWVAATTDPWEITTDYEHNAMGRQTRRTLTPAGEDPDSSTASRVMQWTYTPDGKLASRTDDGVPVDRRVVLVDNSDKQNTNKTGTGWENATDNTPDKAYQGHDYLTHDPGTGANTFTWDLAIPKAGSYQVYARHGAEATATNANYTVHHSGTGTPANLTRDTTGAETWKSLGTFTFNKGTDGQKIVLSDTNPGGVVAADAVKLVRTTGTDTDNEAKSYQYAYDPNGNLDQITDASSGATVDHYTLDYTGANQVDQVIEKTGGPAGTTTKSTDFGYDPNGAISSLVHDAAAGVPDQHSTYTYDTRDLLTQVSVGTSASDPAPKVTDFSYGPRRLRQTQTKHNGNTVTYDYYADQLLKDLHETRSGGADVARHQLTYTPNGHRDTDTTRLLNADDGGYLDFVRDYDYDARDRVTTVEKHNLSGGLLETEQYEYDGANNIAAQTIEDTTTDFDYDRDRLLSATTTKAGTSTTADYNYDPYGRLDTVIAGNGPTDGTVLESYDYDGFDRTSRHTKLTDAGTITTDYSYDPLDRTASRTREPGGAAEKKSFFTYLGLTDTLISEAPNPTGTNPTKTYTYTPDGERLSQTKHLSGGGTEDSYYGYNPHTDVETLTRPNGTTRATYGYTAYGANDEEAFTGVDKPDPQDPAKEPYNTYRYTGKRYDEATGNLDMGFRDYNPGLNRFLTLDAYNGALADQNLTTSAWTSNRYALAGGNPITGIELDGHRIFEGTEGGVYIPDDGRTSPGVQDGSGTAIGGDTASGGGGGSSSPSGTGGIEKKDGPASVHFCSGGVYCAPMSPEETPSPGPFEQGYADAISMGLSDFATDRDHLEGDLGYKWGQRVGMFGGVTALAKEFSQQVLTRLAAKRLAARAVGPNLSEGFASFRAAKRTLPSPGEGKVYDHVVEQSQIARSGFDRRAIHNSYNLNPVPKAVNQAKANYYSSIRPFTGGRTVRDWLNGQGFADQYSFGMDITSRIQRGASLP